MTRAEQVKKYIEICDDDEKQDLAVLSRGYNNANKNYAQDSTSSRLKD